MQKRPKPDEKSAAGFPGHRPRPSSRILEAEPALRRWEAREPRTGKTFLRRKPSAPPPSPATGSERPESVSQWWTSGSTDAAKTNCWLRRALTGTGGSDFRALLSEGLSRTREAASPRANAAAAL